MARVVVKGVEYSANEVVIDKGLITLDGKAMPHLSVGSPRIKSAVVCLVTKMIDDELCVLLLKRNNHPEYGEQWCMPGGKVDHYFTTVDDKEVFVKESAISAAIRELREETGIRAGSVYTAKRELVWADDSYVVECFVIARYKEDESFTFPTREHSEKRWVPLKKLDDLEDLGEFTKNIINDIL